MTLKEFFQITTFVEKPRKVAVFINNLTFYLTQDEIDSWDNFIPSEFHNRKIKEQELCTYADHKENAGVGVHLKT